MSGGRVRKLVVLAVLAALVGALVRALRGDPAPAFEGHPSTDPRPVTPPAAEATVSEEPAVDRPFADQPAEVAAAVAADLDAVEASAPTGAPQPALRIEAIAADARTAFTVVDDLAGADPASSGPADGVAWVPPVDGTCPDGYPIKARLASMIYHRPGGLSYERTRADRCYATAEAAEADGLRAAKR